MVSQDSFLVTLFQLVDRVPMPALPTNRGRGHPIVYSERVFLKAVVIMMVRHLHNVHELLSVLAQPTEDMRTLRLLLTHQERFPSCRTWERRLQAIAAPLPAQIGCLGCHLLDLIQPWSVSGRAVAIDSTMLRARGGVWHQKHREQADRLLVSTKDGRSPHTAEGVEVRRVFHTLRAIALENVNEHFKGLFDGHGQVPDVWLAGYSTLRVGCHFCLANGFIVPL